MSGEAQRVFERYEAEAIDFAQQLVRIPSYSDREGEVAACVKERMERLGYDEVCIDATGNVVGRIGGGTRTVLFDSHMDTVEAGDASEWTHDPFGGVIADGRLYGRGSVDMKSALAASVYGAVAARDLGWLDGLRIYVTGTVCEEFCDGENLRMLFGDSGIKPDYVVICEPSDNAIVLGHKGKAQIAIKTHGVSAHGSAPEKGLNAVYEMAEIIGRVEALNARMSAAGEPHGTVVLSDVSCVSASLNAVPSECAIYLDRRLVLGERAEDVYREMDELIAGKRASWEPGTLRRRSWTGRDLVYEPMHEAWQISREHELTEAMRRAYASIFGPGAERYDFWDFGTNAVTPVSMGIPTIGFGPGEYKLAHMLDENCEVAKIASACRFYAAAMREIAAI